MAFSIEFPQEWKNEASVNVKPVYRFKSLLTPTNLQILFAYLLMFSLAYAVPLHSQSALFRALETSFHLTVAVLSGLFYIGGAAVLLLYFLFGSARVAMLGLAPFFAVTFLVMYESLTNEGVSTIHGVVWGFLALGVVASMRLMNTYEALKADMTMSQTTVAALQKELATMRGQLEMLKKATPNASVP